MGGIVGLVFGGGVLDLRWVCEVIDWGWGCGDCVEWVIEMKAWGDCKCIH
jgi:hypothetical protein